MTETHTLRTDDGRLVAYCDWGPADGVPVFYLHGMPGSRLLRHSAQMYEGAHVHAVTLDRAGCGLSTRDVGRTVASSALDVVAVADALGIDRFAVFGVSAGGPYALAVAACAPDRVTACVTEIGIGPFGVEGLDFFAGMSDESAAYHQAWLAADAEFLERDYQDTLTWIESFRDSTDLPEPMRGVLIEGFSEGLRGGLSALTDEEAALMSPWGFELAQIVCPVRIAVARDDDTVPPAHGAWIADHIDGADLVMLDGGHIHPREAEEQVLLTWLATHA